MSTCRVCGHAICGDNHDCGPKGPTFDDTLRALYDTIAQARREGVLIGVRAGIEAAIAKMEKMGEQWRIEGNEYRERGQSVHVEVAITQQQAYESSAAIIRALDAQAIAERACKGGSDE